MPTLEDKALAAKCLRMLTGRIAPVGREVVHAAQSENLSLRLAHLQGDKPATPSELDRARRFCRQLIQNLDLAGKLAPSKTYDIVRREKSITIDGRLDEDEWQRAKLAPIIYGVSQTRKTHLPHAQARLLWDEDYIYAGYEVVTDGIVAPLLPRDGPVYCFDCIELFLMPNVGSGRYLEINVSPSGSVFDKFYSKHTAKLYSRLISPPDLVDFSYACQIQHAKRAGESDGVIGYSVEMAVPLRELPGMKYPPRAGLKIHGLMAMARFGRPHRPRVFLSHTPMMASFHNIFNFAPFRFVD